MVNKDVFNYIKEGKKRGFSVQLLKQKLLEGGFEDKEISEAIAELNKIESTNLQTASAQQPTQQKTPQYNSSPVVSQTKPLQATSQSVQLNIQQKTSQPTQSSPSQKISPPIQQPQKTSAPLIQSQRPAQQKVIPQVQPENNNPVFSMQSNKIGSTGLWAKISGILGIALLIFLLTFSFIVLSLDNSTVLLFYLVTIIIFSGVYLLGFYKIGKHTESKQLKLGALVMITLLTLFLIVSLIISLTGNKFIAVLLSLSSGSGDGLSITLSIAILLILFLFVISKSLFSIGLIKIHDKVKLSKLSGFVNLAVSIFALIFFILLIILIFSSSALLSSLSKGTSLQTISDSFLSAAAIGIIFIISSTALAGITVISMIIEIIMLFKNAKSL